jgi:predicted nucleic acid-binding protein
MNVAVADASALYAAADAADPDHRACLEQLQRSDLRVIIPTLVVAEVSYLLGSRLGPPADARFMRAMKTQDLESPSSEDYARIAELVESYTDFPLGGVDASVIALAERLGTPIVLTLDRRHFATVRPAHCESLELLPE